MKSGMEEENVSMFDEPRRKQIVNMLDVLGLFEELKLAHFASMRSASRVPSP